MNLFPTEAYLTRVNPEQNMQRFYMLHIVPDLFGGCSLVRRWGRIGSGGGSKRIEHYAYEGKAVDALMNWIAVKAKRGYQVIS